jgi:hypothetical protein
MADYDSLFNLPTGTEDISSVFKTGRGSTYAHHTDNTTTRNRSGENHRDTSTGVQARSGKTIFMDPKDVNNIAGLYQNAEMGTKFVPVLENGKPTGNVALQLMEDYGPKKAGTNLFQAPYKVQPEVGLNPVEIYGSESPVGSSGKNIHWGNSITEVHPKPERLKGLGGKAGIAAALLGGAGAASAGEYRKAAQNVGESLLPWGLTSGDLNTNEDAELAAKMGKGITKARGGMIDKSIKGNLKLI